jgi:hypothetical protein
MADNAQLETQYVHDRSWLIIFSVALIFGIVWTILGESTSKIVFVTVAFMLFLNAGVKTEMSARALHGGDGH